MEWGRYEWGEYRVGVWTERYGVGCVERGLRWSVCGGYGEGVRSSGGYGEGGMEWGAWNGGCKMAGREWGYEVGPPGQAGPDCPCGSYHALLHVLSGPWSIGGASALLLVKLLWV